MATIDIRRAHSLGIDSAKSKAEQLANDLKDKLNLEWSWQGDQIHFKAVKGATKGTSGKLTVSGSEVHVEVDLPLLLRAMKGTIAGKVNEKLDELLG